MCYQSCQTKRSCLLCSKTRYPNIAKADVLTLYVYSDICKTSIYDLHMSCLVRPCDICLTWCLEIRNGKPQACQDDVSWNYINRGLEYEHGEERTVIDKPKDKPDGKLVSKNFVKYPSMSKANEAGIITCYCGARDLVLKRLLPDGCVSDCVNRIEKTAKACELWDLSDIVLEHCLCFNFNGCIDVDNAKLFETASLEGSEDNCLYCPSVRDVQQDDLKHSQHHWGKGEHVVVRNLLEATAGLIWEPIVTYRACRQIRNSKQKSLLYVHSTDCLDFCEVKTNLYELFTGLCCGIRRASTSFSGWIYKSFKRSKVYLWALQWHGYSLGD